MELGARARSPIPPAEFVSTIVLFVPLNPPRVAVVVSPELGLVDTGRLRWAAVHRGAQMVLLSGRSSTVSDLAANTLGALVGALPALSLRDRVSPKSR